MIGWLPAPLLRFLNALLRSSDSSSPAQKPQQHYITGGRPVFGSDLYNEVMEEDRRRKLAKLAEEAEAARKSWEYPN